MNTTTEQLDYIGRFSLDFSIEPERTVLIIIDMQNASASRTAGMGKKLIESGKGEEVEYRFNRIENIVTPNIQKILKKFRENQLKIVYVTLGSEMPNYNDVLPHMKPLLQFAGNYKGSSNHEILKDIRPLPGEVIVNKTTISAFTSSRIETVLKSMDAKYLLFAGVSTNMCVETTARDAADMGYHCTIIEDCCGAAAESYHMSTIKNFKRLFGKVKSVNEVINEVNSKLN